MASDNSSFTVAQIANRHSGGTVDQVQGREEGGEWKGEVIVEGIVDKALSPNLMLIFDKVALLQFTPVHCINLISLR